MAEDLHTKQYVMAYCHDCRWFTDGHSKMHAALKIKQHTEGLDHAVTMVLTRPGYVERTRINHSEERRPIGINIDINPGHGGWR